MIKNPWFQGRQLGGRGQGFKTKRKYKQPLSQKHQAPINSFENQAVLWNMQLTTSAGGGRTHPDGLPWAVKSNPDTFWKLLSQKPTRKSSVKHTKRAPGRAALKYSHQLQCLRWSPSGRKTPPGCSPDREGCITMAHLAPDSLSSRNPAAWWPQGPQIPAQPALQLFTFNR